MVRADGYVKVLDLDMPSSPSRKRLKLWLRSQERIPRSYSLSARSPRGGARRRTRWRHGQEPQGYQDFLALWKDANPDIPILQQARQEYDKLK